MPLATTALTKLHTTLANRQDHTPLQHKLRVVRVKNWACAMRACLYAPLLESRNTSARTCSLFDSRLRLSIRELSVAIVVSRATSASTRC
mmetsp:Transcript_29474/g.48866  ORF Transcript_29474/g.48866 Transcript_29474/m.48866 type:complete len:90 (+) Transcript_29474:68-337(+)